jgi:hypothetical protein
VNVQGRILAEAYPRWGGGGRRIVLLVEPARVGVVAEEKGPKRKGNDSGVSVSVGTGGAA